MVRVGAVGTRAKAIPGDFQSSRLPVRFFGVGAVVLDAAVGCVCARLARTYSEAGRVRPRLAVVFFAN